MFDITTQTKNIFSLFGQDIQQLIKYKELTQLMIAHFQIEFLDAYKRKLPSNTWEGIKLGFSSFWNGGGNRKRIIIKGPRRHRTG
ncbi:hypothetical protein ABF107_004469 [Vibrio parahaemolyticus]|nr:hypothetical protein BBM16_02730 [Vibrio parahaemolyticus]